MAVDSEIGHLRIRLPNGEMVAGIEELCRGIDGGPLSAKHGALLPLDPPLHDVPALLIERKELAVRPFDEVHAGLVGRLRLCVFDARANAVEVAAKR